MGKLGDVVSTFIVSFMRRGFHKDRLLVNLCSSVSSWRHKRSLFDEFGYQNSNLSSPVLCLFCFLDSVQFLDTLETNRRILLFCEDHGTSVWGCWGYHKKVPLTGGLNTTAVDLLTVLKKHSKQGEQNCQGAEVGCAWQGCLRNNKNSGNQGEIPGSSDTSQVPTETMRRSSGAH